VLNASNSKDKIPKVIIFDNESYLKKIKMNTYNLIEAKLIENDILSIVVSYSGGCEKHNFTLAAVPRLANTDSRLQTSLVLGHESNGDSCKKIVKESLFFDLTALKEKYREVYNVKTGLVTLNMTNTNITIEYKID